MTGALRGTLSGRVLVRDQAIGIASFDSCHRFIGLSEWNVAVLSLAFQADKRFPQAATKFPQRCSTWNIFMAVSAPPRYYRPNTHPHAVPNAPLKRIIAITNQKGGVGKTTTAINLAAALAAGDRRVLLVDGDPQGNATSGLGVTVPAEGQSLYEVLLGETPVQSVVRAEVHLSKLDVLPATPDLAGAEVELVNEEGRELRLARAIAQVRDLYDYILIDCPPSLGLLTINMLAAADSILIPLQCEYFALEGLTQLLRTVQLVKDGLNPDLHVGGVLLTMYDSRLNLSRQVADDAREHFGDLVFRTVIPRNIRLAEAPSFGKPILLYDITSVGASSYMAVAKELMQRSETDVSVPSPVPADPMTTETATL
jgi:chromosome partitioning protein